MVRWRKRPRWGAKRQAATCVAEESRNNPFLSRVGGTLASTLPSEGVHALVHHSHPMKKTAHKARSFFSAGFFAHLSQDTRSISRLADAAQDA